MSSFRKEVDYYLYNHKTVAKSKDKDDQSWSKIIDHIKEKYAGKPQGNLIQFKFEQKLKEETILYMLNIERTTYYAWLNKIINEITLMAAYERLIIPYIPYENK
ncbi:MAG: hypothetical protein WHF31_15350 [Candidatus Dehalobacter alkaniphilus]